MSTQPRPGINWLIVDTYAPGSSVLLDRMQETPNVRVVTRQGLEADAQLRFSRGDKVRVTTETMLELALQCMKDANLVRLVSGMKHKIACHHLLLGLYPDFYFEAIEINDLPHRTFEPGKRYVLKPVKG